MCRKKLHKKFKTLQKQFKQKTKARVTNVEGDELTVQFFTDNQHPDQRRQEPIELVLKKEHLTKLRSKSEDVKMAKDRWLLMHKWRMDPSLHLDQKKLDKSKTADMIHLEQTMDELGKTAFWEQFKEHMKQSKADDQPLMPLMQPIFHSVISLDGLLPPEKKI